ncbi:MAG: bifunctional [glutamine synthetase] adenylyltransferase/[glutamine synthetase]-adenylyl-L-tyrosine phosphorylase [Alphaproteobacteria bacterium]|nr:bifunctional [glutamine synthetase] adenylyltransferase/[glutamine synthetase]-adenylyl-L-tyrosine phosphorylase [Alphaproteobacteria bacterium]
MYLSFIAELARLPRAADPARVETGLARWYEAAQRSGETLAGFAHELVADERSARLLAGIFSGSPYLTTLLLRDMGWTLGLFDAGLEAAWASVLADLAALDPATPDRRAVMASLRQARWRAALVTALADLGGIWPVETVVERLSAFCDAAVATAVRHLLADAARRNVLVLPDPADPAIGTGYVVLAVGKLGARELNYSSDIDLIVVFDDEHIETAARDELQPAFVRMTRELVRMLEERTGDGYVFRTDLRLRPDPGATPVAISTEAALTYYESFGQNWERAALIKARPVAGDIAAGQAFLNQLRPFLWRRHLDFAAIQDIHSIKRQIYAHKGGSTVAVEGHDIKVGRGGIREVEFFAQTQQLIWGGRDPSVRSPRTVSAIRALVAAGRIDAPVAEDMIGAYWYLRRLEHRLQMVADQQTQRLPADAEGIAHLAGFLGYDTPDAFRAELVATLRLVESHYAELFEDSAPLGAEGALVFTGADDHPDTIATLIGMGYAEPSIVADQVRGWHHGRYRAMRSTRAREILTELMPALLGAFARTANPDQALRRFDAFLAGLPAGVQLFSLFHSNPPLLDLVAEIMGTSPRLAAILSRNPLLLDAVLDPGFFAAPGVAAAQRASLEERLAEARDMQDVMDLSRRWAGEVQFRIGVQILRGAIDIDAAGVAMADMADAVVGALLPRLRSEFTARHGRIAGDGFAVLALGKYGGRELTAGSDLDLVFLYDVPDIEDLRSDGAQPLSPSHYWQRLSQRLVNALTAQTGDGRLFAVDMRLRPSGNAGPLAVSLDAFARYQTDTAWTWEHLALTRARIVAAAPPFADRIAAAIHAALIRERSADALLLAVADMRARMAATNRAISPWQIKHARGGLVDCEFLAQYLELRHAHNHPEILNAATADAFRALGHAGLLDAGTADDLAQATLFWRYLQGLLRLSAEEGRDPEGYPTPLKLLLARAGEAVDFAGLEAKVAAIATRVNAHWKTIVEAPADALRAATSSSGENVI